MERNPFELAMLDQDKRAKLFLYINIAMMATTFFIVFGTILFILIALGIIKF
ncbi:hypothetical protein [Methanobrevibacter sp.]